MFTAKGIVIEGEKRGREIGFPTANIEFYDPKFSGIFAAKVKLPGPWNAFFGVTYPAAVYVNEARKLLEVHLLHFDGDLYGKKLTVEVFAKIRDSAEFANDADLKDAISRDVASVQKYFVIR